MYTDGCLNIKHIIFKSGIKEFPVLITIPAISLPCILTYAMKTHYPCLLCHFIIVCSQHPPLACSYIFCGIKTERGKISNISYLLPIVYRFNCMGCIFNDKEIMPLCNICYFIHVTGMPCKMDRHYCLCLFCYPFFNLTHIHIQCIHFNIHKHWYPPLMDNHISSSRKGYRCGNYLIPFTNIKGSEREM